MKKISALAALVALGFAAACTSPAAPSAEPEQLAPAAAIAPASPDRLQFTAALRGDGALVATPSAATADAKVALDAEAQTISLDLTVSGITIDQLWDQLVPAPIGPIHFHMYAAHDHSGDNVALAVPVPFGPAYTETPGGFKVTLRDFPYAEAQALTGSSTSFEDFVTSLQDGLIQLNIHTDAFPDGEIGGRVSAAD